MSYKVTVRLGRNWHEFDQVRMGISVGKEYHEGDRLRATLGWIEQRFTCCHLFVADTLQRFNMPDYLKGDGEEARQCCLDDGSRWLERNQSILDQSAIPVKVSRWDDWLCLPEFDEAWGRMSRVFDSDPRFSAAVMADVSAFLSRDQDTACYPISKQEACLNYLLEEMAVVAVMLRQLPFAEVYPGSEPRSQKLIRDLRIPGVPETLYDLRFVEIRHSKIRSAGQQLVGTEAVLAGG